MNNIATSAPQPQALAAFSEQSIFSAAEIRRMPKGMRILFDPHMRDFFQQMAVQMANPQNQMTAPHLKNDVQLCFAIIRRSLNWNMDPYEVASCTYNVKGNLGYYGKLVRGIMLNSGKVREIRFQHGPSLEAWEKVEGKFIMRKSKRTDSEGNPLEYAAPNYSPQDEAGLWCQATAIMHDGTELKTSKKFLRSCQPRNSTVWAYSPMKQIEDVMSRELSNIAVPDIMFGANFDVGLDDIAPDTAPVMTDITPTPKEPRDGDIIDEDGVVVTSSTDKKTDNTDSELNNTDSELKTELNNQSSKTDQKKSTKLVIEWNGQRIYKTKFRTNIKQMVARIEDRLDLAQLHASFITALRDKSEEHNALMHELNPVFKARSEALLGPVEEETAVIDEDGEMTAEEAAALEEHEEMNEALEDDDRADDSFELV